MHTPSIRTLSAIAYERGEEFDPALMLSPVLAESLQGIPTAVAVLPEVETAPAEVQRTAGVEMAAGVELAAAEEMSILTQS